MLGARIFLWFLICSVRVFNVLQPAARANHKRKPGPVRGGRHYRENVFVAFVLCERGFSTRKPIRRQPNSIVRFYNLTPAVFCLLYCFISF